MGGYCCNVPPPMQTQVPREDLSSRIHTHLFRSSKMNVACARETLCLLSNFRKSCDAQRQPRVEPHGGKQLGVSDISTRRRAVRWRGAKCSGTLTPRVGCVAVYIWVPAVFRCAGVLPDILSYTPTCLVMIHAKRHLGLCDGKPFPPVLPFEVDCAERIGGAQP